MVVSDSYCAIFTDIDAYIQDHEDKLDDGVARILLRDIARSKEAIILEYKAQMDGTKHDVMVPSDGEILLDRHKCTACFMVAFLEKLDIESLENSQITSKLLREKIAILIGQSILMTLITERACDEENTYREEDTNLVNFLRLKGYQFMFPSLQYDKRGYTHNWALELHYDRVDKRLSVLPLANTLFLIETYNRQLMDIEAMRTNSR